MRSMSIRPYEYMKGLQSTEQQHGINLGSKAAGARMCGA